MKKLRQGGVGALQKLALEENALGREVLFREAKRKLLRKTGGRYPAPEKALEAVRHGYDKGFERGLEREARLFGDLAVSEVSKRLIDIFFATTALKKDSGVDDPSVKARKVERVGVLGGGLMGSGIAFVTVGAGLPVRVREKDDQAAAKRFSGQAGPGTTGVERQVILGGVADRRVLQAKPDLRAGAQHDPHVAHAGLLIAEVIGEVDRIADSLQAVAADPPKQGGVPQGAGRLDVVSLADGAECAVRRPQLRVG